MNHTMRNAVVGWAVLFLILCFCGRSKENGTAIVIGTETLTIEEIRVLDPGAHADSVRIRNVMIRKALASAQSGGRDDTLISRFLEQVQLQVSEEEWTIPAVSLLFVSAQVVAARAKEKESCRSLCAYIDSLYMNLAKNGTNEVSGRTCQQETDTINCQNTEMLPGFFGRNLGVSDQIAALLYEFVRDQDTGFAKGSVQEMVKGLVFSNDHPVSKTASKRSVQKPPVVDNSVQALRFRGQASIRDSILKHSPDLRLLYKKYLKADETLSGSVMIALRVNAAGQVLSADVKRSEIGNREFLRQLTDYLTTIRFKPIPEKIGNMSFEFPFEFNAEM